MGQTESTESSSRLHIKKIDDFEASGGTAISTKGSQLNKANASKVIAYITQNDLRNVTKLDLSYSSLTQEGSRALFDYIGISITPSVLVLDGNTLSTSMVEDLAQGLHHVKTLETLSLNNCKLNDDSCSTLVKSIQQLPQLRELKLGFNNLTVSTVQAVCQLLKANTELEGLSLSKNAIDSHSCRAIAKALEKNVNLRWLCLAGNSIKANGVKSLADVLERQNRTLLWLGIGANEIGDEGCTYISQYLSSSYCCLRSLGLGANRITDMGAKHLSLALMQNHSLTHLGLGKNFISGYGAEHLAHALKNNKTLKRLILSSNVINDKGLDHIADAVQYNSSLRELLLAQNRMTKNGVFQFLEKINRDGNCRLHSLDLLHDSLTWLDEDEVKSQVEHSQSTLEYVGLYHTRTWINPKCVKPPQTFEAFSERPSNPYGVHQRDSSPDKQFEYIDVEEGSDVDSSYIHCDTSHPTIQTIGEETTSYTHVEGMNPYQEYLQEDGHDVDLNGWSNISKPSMEFDNSTSSNPYGDALPPEPDNELIEYNEPQDYVQQENDDFYDTPMPPSRTSSLGFYGTALPQQTESENPYGSPLSQNVSEDYYGSPLQQQSDNIYGAPIIEEQPQQHEIMNLDIEESDSDSDEKPETQQTLFPNQAIAQDEEIMNFDDDDENDDNSVAKQGNSNPYGDSLFFNEAQQTGAGSDEKNSTQHEEIMDFDLEEEDSSDDE